MTIDNVTRTLLYLSPNLLPKELQRLPGRPGWSSLSWRGRRSWGPRNHWHTPHDCPGISSWKRTDLVERGPGPWTRRRWWIWWRSVVTSQHFFICKPVWGAAHWERSGDGSVSLHGQGQDHVVGGAQGESLQEFENLAEDQASHPPSVQDLPHQLTCDEGTYLLSVWFISLAEQSDLPGRTWRKKF